MRRLVVRSIATMAGMVVAAACGRGPQPGAVNPQLAADSLRARQVADSVAAARRDSLAAAARHDSLAREEVRADSIALAERQRARADSVRAQVLREDTLGTATAPVPSGLDVERTRALAEPVYFGFDRSDLTAEAVERLDDKLTILRASPRLELVIEGHCDERGSDEYYLALGNRRAAAAKRYLVEHGLAEARLGITSYGEERPADPGHSEDAWARNRRAEFVVARGGR